MAGAGGKGRKIGRNAAWCKAYANSNMREQNKLRSMLRHVKRAGKFITQMPADWREAYRRIGLVLPSSTVRRICNEQGFTPA